MERTSRAASRIARQWTPSSPAMTRLAFSFVEASADASMSSEDASSPSPTIATPMLGVNCSFAASASNRRRKASAASRCIPAVYRVKGWVTMRTVSTSKPARR